MRVLITGSRDATEIHRQEVNRVIRAAVAEHSRSSSVTIVHGGCPTGVDWFADQLAHQEGWTVEKHPAQWQTYGKSAGPRRNEAMVKQGADIVLGFPKGPSPGTRNCIMLAKRYLGATKVLVTEL